MATIGYTRVSTSDQSTASQRATIEDRYNVTHWYTEEATSGAVKALERPEFGRLYDYVRHGDTVAVYAIDRLGRDTIDVLSTVEALQAKGVAVISYRENFDLSDSMGKAMLTMLSAVAELERSNIKQRQRHGIDRARASGKHMGRPKTVDEAAIAEWRRANGASIKETAEAFGVSLTAVKRACSPAMDRAPVLTKA